MFIDTPVEEYDGYYVKREDLSCLPPGPPFAKVRGLYKRLQTLKEQGVNTVGYFDTSISMATWGICYFASKLGMKVVVFYYQYKSGLKHNQVHQMEIWKKYGSEVHRLEKPNMQSIQTIISRKKFQEMYPKGEFLIPGLKFEETVEEVSKQVQLLEDKHLGGTIVICTGSGMMCAGVLNGISKKKTKQNVIGVLVHTKNVEKMKKGIIENSLITPFDLMSINFKVVDYKYEYTKKEECDVPFPCCPYYDRKAFKYMIDNIDTLKKPILFWNIGSSYNI